MPDMTTLPPELEPNLRRALHVPGPEAEFVARLRTQIQQEANSMKKENGLQSLPTLRRNQEISDSAKKRISPRLAWGLAAALLILAVTLLATSPAVVEAMKRLFGYVPGAGLVEQGSPLRVLAGPVVVERDGVTLTVTYALSSPDKTVVAYTVENSLRICPGAADRRDRGDKSTTTQTIGSRLEISQAASGQCRTNWQFVPPLNTQQCCQLPRPAWIV